MWCPVCETEEVKKQGPTLGSLLGYFKHTDERGREHDHDPNCYSESWECENGHAWTYSYYEPCPICSVRFGKAFLVVDEQKGQL